MANAYSISRLSSFNQCRLQYKYRYIDKARSEVESVEAFMGSRVHEALQKLYEQVQRNTIKPLDWLEHTYADLWAKKAHAGLKVVHKDRTVDHYRELGRQCLFRYYETYHPFDQGEVLDTESFIKFTIQSDRASYEFCGVLDRLDRNRRDGVYEIHDYKTSGSLPSQEDADADRQLGLYQLAVKSFYPQAVEIRLIWHYLAFDAEIVSRRTEGQLESLQAEIIEQVREIEACRDYPAQRSALCEWCGYQPICAEWKTERTPENKDGNQGAHRGTLFADVEDENKK